MDDNVFQVYVATTLFATSAVALISATKKRRRYWVKLWMARKHKSVFNNLLKEMCLEDRQRFYDYHRMSWENFSELLQVVSPFIKKQDTKMRKAVSPAQRLSITLRYLATGL
ncbi:hypothetical protein E2C01_056386 [Portunus trituberculatus]|uniref:Uncharacterized protein n=1 Tax=Portunus trituberculatus TaxID=210409 RepID=A0A5B7GTZ4_PORTR|nr:hypothetical protein [Portunus trituberculatus]